MLLVGGARGGGAEEVAQGAVFAGCDSGISAEMADDAGGLSARATAESAVSAAAGLSQSGDDNASGGGDFDWEERGALEKIGFAGVADSLANVFRFQDIHCDKFQKPRGIFDCFFDHHWAAGD